jgi:hypothetical protein
VGPTGAVLETWASVFGDSRVVTGGYVGTDALFQNQINRPDTGAAVFQFSNATLTDGDTTVTLTGSGSTHLFLVSWNASIRLSGSEQCKFGVRIKSPSDLDFKFEAALYTQTTGQSNQIWNAGASAIVAMPDNAQLKLSRHPDTPCTFRGDYRAVGMTIVLLK